MASELGSPTPAAKRTILDLGDDLLREIFLRLTSLPSLVRAALACPAFLHAVRSSPAFRRRFQALHPPQLLGFFGDHCRCYPLFFPLRGRRDPDHTAVIGHADFFLTRLTEDSAHEHRWWEIQSCHGGYVILINLIADKIAAYNPLTQALHVFPMPPTKIRHSGPLEFHIVFSEEDLRVFRMVCVEHRKTPTCIAVVSSATMKWTRVLQPEDGGDKLLKFDKDSEFGAGRQVNTLVYWKHLRQDYALVLNTTTLQISRVDLPVGGKGSKLGHSKDGQLCNVGVDDSDANIGKLFAWVWRADVDSVEKWILQHTFALSTLVDDDDEATDDVTVHVEAIIDGFVYLFKNVGQHESLLSLCLETEELNTLFEETYEKPAHPYIMAWPPSLVCNKVGKLAKSKKKRKGRKDAN